VPEGRRTARAVTTVGGKLLGRLREHAKSIQAAANLKLEDFRCRFMVLTEDEADLIELVEARLIRNYKPLWNSGISGFGIHAPGSGRGGQKQSEWDVLHPGRYYAGQLTGKSIPVEEVLQKVEQFLSQLPLP
jgi:Eco29kI-like restriction endonuclease